MSSIVAKRRSTIALLVAAFGASASGATTYTITTLADAVAADGACTLREAIRAAAANVTVNECPAGASSDEILLAATGVYPFALGEEATNGGALVLRGARGAAAEHIIDMQLANRFLRVVGGSTALVDLTLRRGSAPGPPDADGGSLDVWGAVELSLDGVVIEESRASRGGALFVAQAPNGSIRIDRSTLRDNEAVSTVSIPGGGGGAFLGVSEGGSLAITRSAFEGNSAASAGAAVGGGGLQVEFDHEGATSVALRRLVFVENRVAANASPRGGGLFVVARDQMNFALSDAVFERNEVDSSSSLPLAAGSGIEIHASQEAVSEIRRVVLRENEGDAEGLAQLAIHASGASSTTLDGVVVTTSGVRGIDVGVTVAAAVRLGQLTVWNNDGSGIAFATSSTVPPRLENSIVWGNADSGASSDLVVLSGTIDADRETNRNWIGDQGDPDPLFVDPFGGNLSLQESSGAVDAGDSAFATVGPFDANHGPRNVGAELDLGAFERGGLFADGFESGGTEAWF